MSIKTKPYFVDVDFLLTNLKSRGFFQISQFTLLALTYIVCAQSLLKIIFIGILPEVKCSELSEKQLSAYGYSDNSTFVIKYEKCHIEIHSFNDSTNQTLDCVNGYSYLPERSSSFVSEFDLVCDKEGLSELTQTLYSVGGLLASFTIPVLTDKYGRKLIHVTLLLFMLATGIGLSFAPNYWTFTILRSLEGFLNQGMIGPAFTLMLELIPAEIRTSMAASTGVIWGLSVFALAPIAYLFHTFSWRISCLAFSSLAGIVFFEIWYIEESIRWLLTNGKVEKCKRIIRRAAKENGVNFEEVWHKCIDKSTALIPPEIEEEEKQEKEEEKENEEKEEEKEKQEKEEEKEEEEEEMKTKEETILAKGKNVGPKTLITDGTARKITVVVLINGLMNSLTYNMIYMTAAQLSGNFYLNYCLTSLMEVLSNVIMFFMLLKLQRRTTMAFFQILSGSALILAVIINWLLKAKQTAATINVVLSLVGMFGISASYCVIWLYVPEIYPTNLRNVGIGMLGISGTIGNMISPFSRVVVQYIPWLPSTVFGTGSIFATLLLKLLPESRGQQMPSTMDDIRMWKVTRKANKLALQNGRNNNKLTLLP